MFMHCFSFVEIFGEPSSACKREFFYFGGTSFLIVVIVVMDLMSQIQAHLLSHQYEGMMKKANLKGIGGGLR